MSIPYGFQKTREAVATALISLTETLMNHRANDAKVPIDQVQSKVDEYKVKANELQQDQAFLQEIYDSRHKIPRTEAFAAYDEFKIQQQMKRQAYVQTKQRGELQTWLESSFDNKFHNGYMDKIYTKYVHDV